MILSVELVNIVIATGASGADPGFHKGGAVLGWNH